MKTRYQLVDELAWMFEEAARGHLDPKGKDWQRLTDWVAGLLEVAVEEGATLVRVGTAIFGPRPTL